MKNHIKIALLALFLYCNLLAFSQTLTPAFSVKIAFEDKAKHKDTITLGYDPLANNTGIDTIFGEQDTWGVPWDSLFEVKATGGEYAYVTSLGKRVFVKQTTDTIYCYQGVPLTSSIAIFGVHFRCKYDNFPIKITWDYTQFSGTSCHSWSAIVYNCASSEPSLFPVHRMNLPFGVFNLQTPDYYAYIAGENGYIKSTPSNVLAPGGGLTTDTIYTFEIRLSSKFDIFNNTWPVSIQDQTISQLISKVYPNPAQNEVNVTLPEPAWCTITDMSGKTVQNTYLQTGTSTIDVSVLPKGMYLMRLQGKNERYSVHKLMVE
jgi:hypothetical protein